MSCENKISEFLKEIENDKLMMETQFAQIESIIKNNENIKYTNLIDLLSNFNTTLIQYEQLCNDLTLFISLFKSKEEQEIRIYKTDELIEIFENKIAKIEDKSHN